MSFLSVIGKFMWPLNRSRKHVNAKIGGAFGSSREYIVWRLNAPRRACNIMKRHLRWTKEIKPREEATIQRRYKDRRGTEYIQLSTGQIMRRFA